MVGKIVCATCSRTSYTNSYKLWFSETQDFQLAMFDSVGLYLTKTMLNKL